MSLRIESNGVTPQARDMLPVENGAQSLSFGDRSKRSAVSLETDWGTLPLEPESWEAFDSDDLVAVYKHDMTKYPLLDKGHCQIHLLYEGKHVGLTLDEVLANPRFRSLIEPSQQAAYGRAARDRGIVTPARVAEAIEHFEEKHKQKPNEREVALIENGIPIEQFVINCNMRWAFEFAFKNAGRGLEFLDTIQEANFGLMRAAATFNYTLLVEKRARDPNTGVNVIVKEFDPVTGKEDRVWEPVKFSTYAAWWMRRSVGRAIADKSRTIRYPVYMHNGLLRGRYFEDQFMVEHGRPPEDDEIFQGLLGLNKYLSTPRHVHNVMRELKFDKSHVESLDAPVYRDGENDLTVGDTIIDPTPGAEALAADNSEVAIWRKTIARALSEADISERDRDLLAMRVGLNGQSARRLEEVGKGFGITGERVRQVEAKVLKKLRRLPDLQRAVLGRQLSEDEIKQIELACKRKIVGDWYGVVIAKAMEIPAIWETIAADTREPLEAYVESSEDRTRKINDASEIDSQLIDELGRALGRTLFSGFVYTRTFEHHALVRDLRLVGLTTNTISRLLGIPPRAIGAIATRLIRLGEIPSHNSTTGLIVGRGSLLDNVSTTTDD